MPDLPAIYKGFYPFQLACPSFIYPAGYTENVDKLGRVVDEIELLFFESSPGALPDADEINTLKSLAGNHDITYNVHLPTDVMIGHPDPAEQKKAIDAVAATIHLALPLAPSSFTLHLPFTEQDRGPIGIREWQTRVKQGVSDLLSATSLPPRAIAIETLHYPFACLGDIITAFDLSVCLDTGHLMACGEACSPLFNRFQERITICHLHGLSKDRDHIALSNLTRVQAEDLKHLLPHIHTTVSLEVFSVADLAASLDYLHHLCHTYKDIK
ncbi:MAG: cobamide remodeling phosphodiesterase CbiR [Thermodesulfobacteriota bacterium]|nr:cobamide remodeling phosphodiesterase CbiR [Thermodesulfobacteriota bacterium]